MDLTPVPGEARRARDGGVGIAAASGHAPVPATALPPSLRGLAEQLWFGVDDDVVFAVGRRRRLTVPGHLVLESYAVLPSLAHPRVLLPAGPPAATRGAAGNYRALRLPRERVVRGVLAAAAGVGLGVAPSYLHVLAPSDRPGAAASLPLDAVATALGGGELRASIGVRDGANRKATLQMVHTDGRPAGYAKVGWNATTDGYVRTESQALAAMAEARPRRVRVPRRLAALEHAGHPIVVMEPLPLSVRTVRPDQAPTSVELYDIAPVVRTDRLESIGQVRALRQRLAALTSPMVAGVAGPAARLLDQVAAQAHELVVAARWHGDLASWNVARDADGDLWVWDWESCEADAPAGLDALHWALSVQRLRVGPGALRLDDCLADAAPHLVAAAVPRATWGALLSVYVGVVVERACSLAVEDGGWDRLWIQPADLAALVARAAASPTLRAGSG